MSDLNLRNSVTTEGLWARHVYSGDTQVSELTTVDMVYYLRFTVT